MKKSLLLLSLTASTLVSAQLTQSNEPSIGESETMYLCDSNYTNYAAITGPAVTWDYSQIASYAGELRDVEVVDPSTTPNAASYGTSTKALMLGDNITTYFNSSASDRVSQGFVFNEPSLGDIIVTFEDDNMTQMNYPFAYGSSFSDYYEGTISYNLGLPSTSDLTGNAHISVDGAGTLMFPLGVSVSNVIRVKSIDTAIFNEPVFLGDVEVVREQYEYYDLASQNLPIFIHTSMTISQVGGGMPIASNSIVLSKYPTEHFVGIEENNAVQIKVYPNPATDQITFDGIDLKDARISFVNYAGKTVKTISEQEGSTINVNDLSNGLYIVIIEKDGQDMMTKFTKK